MARSTTTIQPLPSPGPRLRQDSLAVGLLVGALVALGAMLLWLAATYNSLPDLLPLHFDAQGNPDRIGDRSELLVLPIIGVGVYLVNGAVGLMLRLRYQMIFAPYLLWAGALLVQILLWLALWNLTH